MKIHVLCASDRAFMAHTATMLASVFAHNESVAVHWIYTGVSDSALRAVKKYFDKRADDILFYKADTNCLKHLFFDRHASIANYFRILAPDLLPPDIKRVLYLDSDAIVRKSLDDLWSHDLRGLCVGAVQDPKSDSLAPPLGLREDDYFNSGVMLMDLDEWRRQDIHNSVLAFVRDNAAKITYWDQDGLNAVLNGGWSRLSITWNAQHSVYYDDQLRLAYGEIVRDPHIVHFSGQGLKPWEYGSHHPFKQEYLKYRRRSPWPRYRESGAPSVYGRARIACAKLSRAYAVERLDENSRLRKAARYLFLAIPAVKSRMAVHQAAKAEQARRARLEQTRRQMEIASALAETFRSSNVVRTGPFRGMRYLTHAQGSQLLPKIAGTYEQPLHGTIAELSSRGSIRRVVNVGSAEGYYAVGLALTLEQVEVYAFDRDHDAVRSCAALAAMNDVQNRVIVGHDCSHRTLDDLVTKDTLLICDIEGGELELIDPLVASNLRRCEMLVEMHDFLKARATDALIERFRQTHRIAVIVDYPRDCSELREVLLNEDAVFDQRTLDLIVDEVRPPGMRWLHMVPLGK